MNLSLSGTMASVRRGAGRVVGVFAELVGAGKSAMRALFRGRRGDPPTRGTRELLEVYETSPWVRAVHGRISTSIGQTEWTLGRSDRPDEVITDHIMLRVLRNPNPLMSGHDLFKITDLHIDLVGDAFWLKVRNGFGAPVQLMPIPPHWVIDLPTPEYPVYRISFGSLQDLVPETEILRMTDVSPANPYRRGAGLVRSQADEIETHEYASKHAKQLFFNRATPEYVVMDDGASGPDVDTHERAWMQRLQGYWRWQKPYFTNRKLEFWQPQQMNLDNLTMVPLMKYERDVILQTTGMPPEQLGIVENSNRATIDGSNYVYESRVVLPRREAIRDALQMRLVPEYDPRLVLGFVNTVPEDKTHELAMAKAAPHTVRVDEWRKRQGLPLVGGPLGNSFIVPLNSYLTPDPLDQSTRPKTSAGPGVAGDEREERETEDEPKEEPVGAGK